MTQVDHGASAPTGRRRLGRAGVPAAATEDGTRWRRRFGRTDVAAAMADGTRWRRRFGRAGIAAAAVALPMAAIAPAAPAAPVAAAKRPAPVHQCIGGPGFFSLFPIIVNDVCYTVTTTRSGDQIMTFRGHQ